MSDDLLRRYRAAGGGRVALQRCEACRRLRWPPAPICPSCLAPGGAWEAVDGAGTVWSVAVYEHAFAPELSAELPYAVALIELDAGPSVISRVVGVAPRELEPGARVTVADEPLDERSSLPVFRPA